MKTKFTICTLNVENGKAKITQEEFLANYSTTQTAYEKRHDKPGRPRYIASEFRKAFDEVRHRDTMTRATTLYVDEMGDFIGKGFGTLTGDGITAHVVFLGEPPEDKEDYSRILYETCTRVLDKKHADTSHKIRQLANETERFNSIREDVYDTYLAASPEFVFKPLGGNR